MDITMNVKKSVQCTVVLKKRNKIQVIAGSIFVKQTMKRGIDLEPILNPGRNCELVHLEDDFSLKTIPFEPCAVVTKKIRDALPTPQKEFKAVGIDEEDNIHSIDMSRDSVPSSPCITEELVSAHEDEPPKWAKTSWISSNVIWKNIENVASGGSYKEVRKYSKRSWNDTLKPVVERSVEWLTKHGKKHPMSNIDDPKPISYPNCFTCNRCRCRVIGPSFSREDHTHVVANEEVRATIRKILVSGQDTKQVVSGRRTISTKSSLAFVNCDCPKRNANHCVSCVVVYYLFHARKQHGDNLFYTGDNGTKHLQKIACQSCKYSWNIEDIVLVQPDYMIDSPTPNDRVEPL